MSKIGKFYEQFLSEDKTAMIKRLALVPQEDKENLIEFFKRNPHLETKVDWNQVKTLTYDDFKEVMSMVVGSKRQVPMFGEKGIDWIDASKATKGLEGVAWSYSPLTWLGAQALRDKKLGGVEGLWCISDPRNNSYWIKYTQTNGKLFICMMLNGEKIMVEFSNSGEIYKVWDDRDEDYRRSDERFKEVFKFFQSKDPSDYFTVVREKSNNQLAFGLNMVKKLEEATRTYSFDWSDYAESFKEMSGTQMCILNKKQTFDIEILSPLPKLYALMTPGNFEFLLRRKSSKEVGESFPSVVTSSGGSVAFYDTTLDFPIPSKFSGETLVIRDCDTTEEFWKSLTLEVKGIVIRSSSVPKNIEELVKGIPIEYKGGWSFTE